MTEYEQEITDLLRDIRDGSQEAARTFLDRYGKYLLAVIRRRLADRLRSKFDSQDFLQDVCASFFRRPPPPEVFSKPEMFLQYLANMARNKVADQDRNHFGPEHCISREKSLDGSARLLAQHLRQAGPSPSEAVGDKEILGGMGQGRATREQDLMYLLVNGYTHEEIARYVGLSRRQVERLLERVRKKLSS